MQFINFKNLYYHNTANLRRFTLVSALKPLIIKRDIEIKINNEKKLLLNRTIRIDDEYIVSDADDKKYKMILSNRFIYKSEDEHDFEMISEGLIFEFGRSTEIDMNTFTISEI